MNSMRITTGHAIYALAFLAGSPAAASPSPEGLWARGDGNAKVRIERCPQGFCAVNTWIKEGTPDEKVGDYLVMKVAPDGPTSLAGDAYDPQRKMSYRIHIRTGDKSMTTTGCVWGLLCKDMNWSRIEGAAE